MSRKIFYLLLLSYFIHFINVLAVEPQFETRIDLRAKNMYPKSICASDFDGDGDTDLAIANLASDESILLQNVSVLLNNGDCTFQPKVDYKAGRTTESIFASDLDSDGSDDLVVVNRHDNFISILYNNGDATFRDVVDYDVGLYPGSATAADFNGDGKQDLAVTVSFAYVAILINKGNSKFDDPIKYCTPDTALIGLSRHIDNDNDGYRDGFGAKSICASDLDGDGDQDLVVTSLESISMLFNKGNGTFDAYVCLVCYGIFQFLISSDFDGDGDNDLAVTDPISNSVKVFMNKGMGEFYSAVDYAAGDFPSSIRASDFDRDGHIDLAVENVMSDDLSIFKNKGDGTFQTATTYPVIKLSDLFVVSDFDGDNDVDIVLITTAGRPYISILKNRQY
ncbi:MAG: VCBS repeat-containing protein [candidate division Zixibacteria bacterium]|nr:VCBS repeat-containing protein [candidate division Zixibacteria bacterium]